MTKTFAQEILSRYCVLWQSVLADCKTFPLPPLGDVDEVDIAVIVTTMFAPFYGNGKDSYREVLLEAMRARGVSMTPEQFDKAYPAIHEFLDWMIENIRAK